MKKEAERVDPRAFLERGSRVRLYVEDFTLQGKGVGHLDQAPLEGYTVFVSGGLPGDLLSVRLSRVKRDFAEGEVEELIRAENRRPSPCPYSDRCNGCDLIGEKREVQLAWKQRMVKDCLIRLAKAGNLEGVTIPVFSDPEHELAYRNKLNLQISPEGRLGYSQRGSHQVFSVDRCPAALPAIQQLMADFNHSIAGAAGWQAVKNRVHTVLIRSNRKGETILALVTDPLSSQEKQGIFRLLAPLGADILCLSQTRNKREVRLLPPLFFASDRQYLEEEIGGMTFQLSPPSFFQVNPYIAPQLYQHALSCFSQPEESVLLDLYCGTGTTTLLASRLFKRVVGVEISREAVEDGRKNAWRNRRDNVSFVCAPAERVIDNLIEESGADQVLLDPPRRGLDKKVCLALGQSRAREIVYISCNPSTLARDAGSLLSYGFRIKKVEAFDMFPNTSWVEAVALFSRSNTV